MKKMLLILLSTAFGIAAHAQTGKVSFTVTDAANDQGIAGAVIELTPADNAEKIERCRARAAEGENYTDKQLIKQFKEIDGGRKKLHDLLGTYPWGDKAGYDLMLNTTNIDIKKIIPALAEYIKNSTK